jgi:hypothetical protein
MAINHVSNDTYLKAILLEDVEENQDDLKSFRPHVWRRFTVYLTIVFIVVVTLIHVEFSFSTPFSDNNPVFIVVFKAIYFTISAVVIEPILRDNMLMVSELSVDDHSLQ